MKPFVRALPLPRKYLKPGVLAMEVTEYTLRSRRMPNGYWVTLAAVIVHSHDRTVFGASACSPVDAHLFDRSHAANRALGRARQVAFRVWSGEVKACPEIAPESLHDTLFGKELDAVYVTPTDVSRLKIEAIGETLFLKVAKHAARISAAHQVKLLNRLDKYLEWSATEKR